jgi:hypothetical protein
MRIVQTVKHGCLVSTSYRDICTRRAVIHDNGDGTFRYEVFHNESRYLNGEWPPMEHRPWPANGDDPLTRLKDYIEGVQFGHRHLEWIREGNTLSTDTMLGDSGGSGFTENELALIRSEWKPRSEPQNKAKTRRGKVGGP